jgi:CRISPR-associated protein Csd2
MQTPRRAPSHKLFEAVSVKRRDGIEVPRSFTDYEVTIDRAAMPAGVEVIERI